MSESRNGGFFFTYRYVVSNIYENIILAFYFLFFGNHRIFNPADPNQTATELRCNREEAIRRIYVVALDGDIPTDILYYPTNLYRITSRTRPMFPTRAPISLPTFSPERPCARRAALQCYDSRAMYVPIYARLAEDPRTSKCGGREYIFLRARRR